MEGDNDIFLADDDALAYFAGPMYKKCSMTFIWGCPFSTCESYDRFYDDPISPIVWTCTHLEYFSFLCMRSHRVNTALSRLDFACLS